MTVVFCVIFFKRKKGLFVVSENDSMRFPAFSDIVYYFILLVPETSCFFSLLCCFFCVLRLLINEFRAQIQAIS